MKTAGPVPIVADHAGNNAARARSALHSELRMPAHIAWDWHRRGLPPSWADALRRHTGAAELFARLVIVLHRMPAQRRRSRVVSGAHAVRERGPGARRAKAVPSARSSAYHYRIETELARTTTSRPADCPDRDAHASAGLHGCGAGLHAGVALQSRSALAPSPDGVLKARRPLVVGDTEPYKRDRCVGLTPYRCTARRRAACITLRSRISVRTCLDDKGHRGGVYCARGLLAAGLSGGGGQLRRSDSLRPEASLCPTPPMRRLKRASGPSAAQLRRLEVRAAPSAMQFHDRTWVGLQQRERAEQRQRQAISVNWQPYRRAYSVRQDDVLEL